MSAPRLPLFCRLSGHGWQRDKLWAPNQTEAWRRQTCDRCRDIDLPTPEWEPR